MKIQSLLILTIVLLASACKKEPNPGSTGQFSFYLNGVQKTFTVTSVDCALAIYDTAGVKAKIFAVGNENLNGNALNYPLAELQIFQTLPLPCSDSFSIGTYRDGNLNQACNNSVDQAGCVGFGFTYVDSATAAINGNGLITDYTDTAGLLSITSFSIAPNLASGTFNCRLTDNNGNYYAVTNGIFNNVPFNIQR